MSGTSNEQSTYAKTPAHLNTKANAENFPNSQ